jgi:hypothetical protein
VTDTRVGRATRVAVVIVAAVSCSVYDASLLGKGPTEGNVGGTSSGASQSGAAGDASPAAGSGSAGKPAANGGASGEGSGGGGMMDAAGAPETGGQNNEGGTAGSGTAGSGDTAGSDTAGGGTAGGGAAGGGTGGGGAGGNGGGAGGNGGAAGAGTGGTSSATGCAKLSVPLDGQNDRAHFVISLPSAIDLSATTATISMRLYVQAGVGGTVFNYVQDSQYRFFGVSMAMRRALSSISGWQTLTFNVGALTDTASPAIVKSDIRRIGIEINAAPSTAWSNPTIVYVDSITVLQPALAFTFDTTSTVTATPTGSDVPGQVMWRHNGTSDTTATGVTLSWQATCP